MPGTKDLPSPADLLMERHQDAGQQRRPGHFLDDSSTPSSPTVSDLLNSSPANFAVPPGPGSSSPSSQPPSDSDTCFSSPQRPKSTPFPCATSDHSRASSYVVSEVSSRLSAADPETGPDMGSTVQDHISRPPPATTLGNLPTEIQEAILDHIFGFRVSPTSTSAMSISSVGTKSWSTAMRHPRQRELTRLSLVNPTWRSLVQQRLYRHIKLKGTIDSLEDAMAHFATHQYLRPLVRHVEIWFPVFQSKYNMPGSYSPPSVPNGGLPHPPYVLPRNKCTLQEAFKFVSTVLPKVLVLTLEGGERRKAPQVMHFAEDHADELVPGNQLAELPAVRTLITRGQWNLARNNRDFNTLFRALPSLVEWHGSYSKAKSKVYTTMCDFLPFLPQRIKILKLSLEADYRREPVMPPFFCKASCRAHICDELARAATSLEHFSYTGRCCHVLFNQLAKMTDPLASHLQSIDLTVKNCCRPHGKHHDSGSGIEDIGFINAFEKLVMSAIRSLSTLDRVHTLRVRFVDLDCMTPPLNPYFVLENNRCTGVWSPQIINEMNRVRPEARFGQLSESFSDIAYNKDGRMVMSHDASGRKVTSLKLENYQLLLHRIVD